MAFSDSWLKEFEEAMKLAEDISSRLRERELILSSGGDPAHLVSATRRKITVLGTCLDRLESLLQNPPDKPILDEEELYRRQDMLLGIRFKTNQMAASFSTSPTNRAFTATGMGESAYKDQVFTSGILDTSSPLLSEGRKEKITVRVDLPGESDLQTSLLSKETISPSCLSEDAEEKPEQSRCWNTQYLHILQISCLSIVAIFLLVVVYEIFN